MLTDDPSDPLSTGSLTEQENGEDFAVSYGVPPGWEEHQEVVVPLTRLLLTTVTFYIYGLRYGIAGVGPDEYLLKAKLPCCIEVSGSHTLGRSYRISMVSTHWYHLLQF